MDPEKAARELDDDCSIARVQAALENDMGLARLDDAMRRATPLAESGALSPLAMALVGTIYRAHDDGDSLAEMRASFVRGHDGSANMADAWDRAVEQITRHRLLPPGVQP